MEAYCYLMMLVYPFGVPLWFLTLLYRKRWDIMARADPLVC